MDTLIALAAAAALAAWTAVALLACLTGRTYTPRRRRSAHRGTQTPSGGPPARRRVTSRAYPKGSR